MMDESFANDEGTTRSIQGMPPKALVTGNFFICLESDSNKGSGKRKRAANGNQLVIGESPCTSM